MPRIIRLRRRKPPVFIASARFTKLSALELIGCAVLALLAPVAIAQQFPVKPMRIIVPYAPGGGTDILARLYAQKLTESWGQSVVVENRPGADGVIGSGIVARSSPDGYTLALVVAAHVINASMKRSLPYDVLKDFAPVTLVAASPWVVVVNPAVPANNIQELIALAKAQPGKLAFGSSEPSSRLAGELFKSQAGIDLLHVPYKGGSQIMTDLLGGHIQIGFTSLLTVLQHYKSGRLRVLGVGTRSRSPSMPDIPSVIEAGLPGYETSAWYGLYAPAGTPQEIILKVQREFVRISTQPDIKERLAQLGADSVVSTPDAFAAFTKSEMAKYAKVVKDAGITPE